MKGIKEVIKRLLSFFEDSDGRLSSSRLMGTILVLAYVVWGTEVVGCEKGIPDIPLQLVSLIVTLYGINKVTGIFKGVSKNDSNSG